MRVCWKSVRAILDGMKTIPALCSVVAVLLMASCASPIQRRIEKNPQLYSALSDRHKILVQRGEIEEGMSKPAVFLSWGRADRVATGTKHGKAYERWSYSGYEAVRATSFGMGFGYSHFHGRYGYDYAYGPAIYPESIVDYVPYEAARVEVLVSKVSAWSATR